MDIPDLVQQALGDEEIQAGVSLGDEDAICLTPTRTLVYNGEGLLSDENVSEYPHDVEQIYVKDGRRKRKFVLEYIDGTQSFSVPSNRGEKVLELLLEGVLRLESVIEPRESLAGVYLFSELTLVIAEGRLIKHIGEPVWNEDFEVYPFEDVTRLDFERGSVATSIVLDVGGRPQRVKVPNDNAPIVRQTLEKALFAYFDVSSLEELNALVQDSEEDASAGEEEQRNDLAFGSGIDPLVTDHDDEDPLEGTADAFSPEQETDALDQHQADQTAGASDETPPSSVETDGLEANERAGTGPEGETNTEAGTSDQTDPKSGASGQGQTESTASADTESVEASSASASQSVDEPETAADEWTSPVGEQSASSDDTAEEATLAADSNQPGNESTTSEDASTEASASPLEADPETTGVAQEGVSREEFEAVADRVDELTEAVDRQNQLLKRQHKAIKQLVQELERQ